MRVHFHVAVELVEIPVLLGVWFVVGVPVRRVEDGVFWVDVCVCSQELLGGHQGRLEFDKVRGGLVFAGADNVDGRASAVFCAETGDDGDLGALRDDVEGHEMVDGAPCVGVGHGCLVVYEFGDLFVDGGAQFNAAAACVDRALGGLGDAAKGPVVSIGEALSIGTKVDR